MRDGFHVVIGLCYTRFQLTHSHKHLAVRAQEKTWVRASEQRLLFACHNECLFSFCLRSLFTHSLCGMHVVFLLIHRHHLCVSIVFGFDLGSRYMAGFARPKYHPYRRWRRRFVIAEKFIGLCKSNSYGFIRWVDGCWDIVIAVAYSNWSRHA